MSTAATVRVMAPRCTNKICLYFPPAVSSTIMPRYAKLSDRYDDLQSLANAYSLYQSLETQAVSVLVCGKIQASQRWKHGKSAGHAAVTQTLLPGEEARKCVGKHQQRALADEIHSTKEIKSIRVGDVLPEVGWVKKKTPKNQRFWSIFLFTNSCFLVFLTHWLQGYFWVAP